MYIFTSKISSETFIVESIFKNRLNLSYFINKTSTAHSKLIETEPIIKDLFNLQERLSIPGAMFLLMVHVSMPGSSWSF